MDVHSPGLLTSAAEPTTTDNPGAFAHTTQVSSCTWPVATGNWAAAAVGLGHHPSRFRGAHDTLLSAVVESRNLTPPHTGEVPVDPGSPSDIPPPTVEPVSQGIPDTRKEPTTLGMTAALAEARQR